MISFPTLLGPDGKRLVQQTLVHPAAYLDTKAIRLLADDAIMGDRFRAALLEADGTLVLSDLSIGDFTAFGDARHARAAGRFIDSPGANLFFQHFRLFQSLIERSPSLCGKLINRRLATPKCCGGMPRLPKCGGAGPAFWIG